MAESLTELSHPAVRPNPGLRKGLPKGARSSAAWSVRSGEMREGEREEHGEGEGEK